MESLPPDLSIIKTHTGPLTVGQNISYSLQVTADPVAGNATNTITVTDPLPTGLAPVSLLLDSWRACQFRASRGGSSRAA